MAEEAAFLHLNTQATDQQKYIPREKEEMQKILTWIGMEWLGAF